MPAHHASAAQLPGTPAAAAFAGAGLHRALAEARPERAAIDEVVSVVDDGVSDLAEELAGDVVFERDEFASPEEAALSVRETVPGATDHDDQHGVKQDQYDED